MGSISTKKKSPKKDRPNEPPPPPPPPPPKPEPPLSPQPTNEKSPLQLPSKPGLLPLPKQGPLPPPKPGLSPSPKPGPSPPPKPTIYVALFHYKSTGDGDISTQPGDLLVVKKDSNPDWLLVQNIESREIGYVPKTYVAKQESLEKEEWFAGPIPRSDTEKILMKEDLPEGTFLVRVRKESNDFALSIKYRNPDSNSFEIRHYRIKKTDKNQYYLSPKNLFPSIQELVRRYTDKGLCCKLTKPCPKNVERLWDLSPKTQENYEIPKSDLNMIRSLGHGFFGEVWHARWRNHKDVAVKMLKLNSDMSKENFLKEATIMKECRHKNLVSLFGICTAEEPICILTEYMSNGNLQKYLQNGEGKTLPINVLIDMCAQVAKGMFYLESLHIVHRDLAARNVLVGDKEGSVPLVRVADFGLAKIFNEEYAVYISQPGGKLPIKWTAPEALLYNTFSVKSDVWSYGILLYEIFSRGCIPYPGMTGGQVVEKLKDGYRMPCPKDCPSPVYEIMRRCWAENADKRDTFEYLFSFFDDYNVSAQMRYFPLD